MNGDELGLNLIKFQQQKLTLNFYLGNKRCQSNNIGDVSLMASAAVTKCSKDSKRHVKIRTRGYET